MPLAPAIAAALTTPAAHAWSLWIDGLDVIRRPGATANTYGTPFPIEVTEAAPGGVSGMVWTIEDPAGELTLGEGAWCVLWDHTNDVPRFAGWLQKPTIEPWGLGRIFGCQAIGIEAILDWAVSEAFTGSVNYFVGGMIQAAVALAHMPANAPALNAASAASSSRSTPLGTNGLGAAGAATVGPGTLRSVIQDLLDAAATGYLGADEGTQAFVTVDWYGGLRVWRRRPGTPTDAPSDYSTLTISDTAGGALVAAGLKHTKDAGSVIRGVLVVGGNAAGSGMVMDGTGEAGRIDILTDSAITDETTKQARAWAIIGRNRVAERGEFDLEDVTWTTTVHPGSPLAITDAQVGISGTSYNVGELVHTLKAAGKSTVRVNYGKPRPSWVDDVGRKIWRVGHG